MSIPRAPQHGAQCEEWGAPRENDLQDQGWLGPLCSAGKAWGRGEIWAPPAPTNQTMTPWPLQELVSPAAGLGGTACAHLIPDALSLTGALRVHPQVGAELVGAHPRVAPRARRQAGPRSQPSQEQQQPEWPQGRHEDRGTTRWGVWPLAPPQTPQAPSPAGIHPPRPVIGAPAFCPGLPCTPRLEPTADAGLRPSRAESVHVAPAPPPPGPSGQLRAGGGETRKAGEGPAPRSTETLATRVTKGRRRAALDREGRGHCCNRSPSPLQALGSGMEGPWDQSCPAGGGRAGQPLPQSRPPPGSHCVRAELQGLCIQPSHRGVLLPSRGASSPAPSHRHNPRAGLGVKSKCFLLERGIRSTKIPGGRCRLGLLW